MHLRILNAWIDSIFCSFSQVCIYYYADVVLAVVNANQEEDELVYTEEIIKNKEGKVVCEKNTKIS